MMSYVPPDKLHSVWPRVRALVETAGRKIGPRHLTSEILFHALRSNSAALHLVGEEGRVDGMIVTQRLQEPSGEPVLFVWVAAGDLKQHMSNCVRELEQLARSIGAGRIQMRSTRRGWTRGMADYWHPVDTLYEHEVA